MDELGRVNAQFKLRWQMSRAGTPVNGDFPAEYHFDLIEAVSHSTNPLVISSLAAALGTGRRAQEGLAKFGEQVAPVVLPLVQQTRLTPGALDEPPPYVVADAIGALALTIERPEVVLSTPSRLAMIDAARQRLSGRQDPAVITAACRLAVATKDPGLRTRVQQLAQDRRQVTALGVTDEASAVLIQRVAARELQRR